MFQKFLKLAETQSGKSVKFVVSDNRGKFVNKTFQDLFETKGITHLKLAPYTPQQNPLAKQGN